MRKFKVIKIKKEKVEKAAEAVPTEGTAVPVAAETKAAPVAKAATGKAQEKK